MFIWINQIKKLYITIYIKPNSFTCIYTNILIYENNSSVILPQMQFK